MQIKLPKSERPKSAETARVQHVDSATASIPKIRIYAGR
jgi:hypothetical protein